jgi:peroxiredoxin
MFFLVAGCGPETSPPIAESAAPESGPEFVLMSLDGERMGPGSFRGRVVLFDFWATWCIPCYAQAEILETIYPEFSELGVEFVAVSLGEMEATVRNFVAQRPFPYPVLIDPDDRVSIELGIYVLPTVMVLDREGRISYLREGVSSRAQLRRVLQTTLAGSEGRVAL